MKLKAITYALMYGRNPETLKRTEGARRVKQASKRVGTLRNQLKQNNYCNNYGSSSKLEKPVKDSEFYSNGKFVGTKVRSKLPEMDFSKLEERLAAQGDLDRMKLNELGYKTCN